MTAQMSRVASSPRTSAPAIADVRRWAAARGLTARPGLAPLAHAAVLVLAWAMLCVVGFAMATWWLWPPIWLACAFLLMGLAGAAHDCVHGTFATSRLGNTIAGHLLLLPAGAPFATYRQFHLSHHAHTLGERDPEGHPADFTARWQYLLYLVGLGPGFLATIWFQTIAAAVGHPPTWAATTASRRTLRNAWFPTLPLLIVMAVACTQSSVVRAVWLGPWLFLMCPVLAFVLLSEHYAGSREEGLLANTYTIQSNPVTSFVVFNINHHTAHHLAPRVPGGRLHHLDEVLAPYEVHRPRGYLAFHADLIRRLPWRSPRSQTGNG